MGEDRAGIVGQHLNEAIAGASVKKLRQIKINYTNKWHKSEREREREKGFMGRVLYFDLPPNSCSTLCLAYGPERLKFRCKTDLDMELLSLWRALLPV